MSLYVRIGEGSSLRLTRAELRFKKKGNVANLYLDPEPKLKELSSNQSQEHKLEEPKETVLVTLSSDKSPESSLDLVRETDFALRQSGEYGDVMVYGQKSRENDKIEPFDFDAQRGTCIVTLRVPPARKFEFVEVKNHEYAYDMLPKLPIADQEKITAQRLEILNEFMRTEKNMNKDGSTS